MISGRIEQPNPMGTTGPTDSPVLCGGAFFNLSIISRGQNVG